MNDALVTRRGQRRFVKMHGLRNHFAIVDVRKDGWRPDRDETIRLCNVQTGIGADQLILIEPSDKAHVFMRILNSDGREAEACGNATRCVAWLLLQELAADVVRIETLAGVLRCERAGDKLVRCDMGGLRTDWESIPLREACDTAHLALSSGPLNDPVAVSVGNPHAVFFVDDLDAVDVARHAPAIQQHEMFPQQVNVGVAQVVDDATLRLQVFERGAGLTMACGSGACAAVHAARIRGLTSSKIMTVRLPGGDVQIEISESLTAIMTGPVAYSFSGRF